MQQTNAPDESEPICVRTSSVALLQLEFRGPRSSSRPSSDLSMQQTNAPDHSDPIRVRTSSVALLQPEFNTENCHNLSR
eukprot:355746-Pyramimonas_sp.AAC.1